jgi:CheY-like chemotaxis protein
MNTSEAKRGSGTRRQVRIVLVVEDDDGCRDEVCGVLQDAGYAVLEAADGEQALQVLLSDQMPEPTVILLDMWLPRMTGQDLLRVIRNYHRLARIPLVLTSASEMFADYAVAKRAGWLPKPFDAQTLLAQVSQRCGGEPSSSPIASSAG